MPRKLDAPGILTHRLGAYPVYSTTEGWVSHVWAQQGQALAAGAPILALTSGTATTVVRAIAAGQVIEVLVVLGQYTAVGAVLARVDATDPGDEQLVAVLYVPAGAASAIRTGADVDLSPQGAPDGTVGLHGTVTSVGQVPQTTAQIGRFLGDDELAGRFTAQGQPIKVEVRLTGPDGTDNARAPAAVNPPGYRIGSRTVVIGA